MSDPIAQAAEALSAAPSSTEPLQVAPEVAPVGERSSLPSSGEAGSGEAGNADAPTSPSGAATPAITGNVLLNAAPVVAEMLAASQKAAALGDQMFEKAMTNGVIDPALAEQEQQAHDAFMDQAQKVAAALTPEPLPRESHLMMLEAKIARFRAKLANAERVALDEFEAIIAHVKAVL